MNCQADWQNNHHDDHDKFEHPDSSGRPMMTMNAPLLRSLFTSNWWELEHELLANV